MHHTLDAHQMQQQATELFGLRVRLEDRPELPDRTRPQTIDQSVDWHGDTDGLHGGEHLPVDTVARLAEPLHAGKHGAVMQERPVAGHAGAATTKFEGHAASLRAEGLAVFLRSAIGCPTVLDDHPGEPGGRRHDDAGALMGYRREDSIGRELASLCLHSRIDLNIAGGIVSRFPRADDHTFEMTTFATQPASD